MNAGIRGREAGETMVTKPRKWPQNCEYARLDAIALADQAWAILDMLYEELKDASQVRRVGRAMAKMQEIQHLLEMCKHGTGEE